ncbi:MAG: flagellar hook-associated protein 3 [Rhodospirillaceae bacterium]|nr:flagellar hook-associated protein 3 [Rhodospirillaceae bacterium]OUU25206.1 MAG: flagellar hook-associated protein 3 [Candidatus Endolissoclinum sp. TMED37]
MQVSTKLFNDQQIRQFGKLTEDIQEKQEKIASGKAILKASDDPVAAVELSAAREQEQLLTRFEENSFKAQNRLNSADKTLQEALSVMTRIAELATQARSPAYDGFSRKAILTEVTSLKETLVDLANTKDSYGQSLFSGFRTDKEAFVRNIDGTISYNGDRGTHTVQVSENVIVGTGVDGETVFGRVETVNGRKSIFEIVEGVMASIDPLREINELAVAQGNAKVNLELPRQNQDWEFTLKGSVGAVKIEATLAEGMEEKLADAINSKSDQTGVTAEYIAETNSISLSEKNMDQIIIEDIEIEGQGISNEAGFYHMTVIEIDENGAEVGKARFLTDEDQLLGRGIQNLLSSIDHISLQQAQIGAQMSKAAIQQDMLESRKQAVTKNISAISDADLAELITKLQSQLTNREAAQQAFAKIGQQSLFDYIR